MAHINLRKYYPWYTEDEIVEVSEEVAAVLIAAERYERAYRRRMFYHKAHFSLDREDGIEASALACHKDNPELLFEAMENHCRLCQSLNSLPEIQGRRVEAHFLLGKTRKEIADAEGVSESAVNQSIELGLKAMKKFFSKNFENCLVKCH